MVKRDAPATSPSHYSFGSASSQRNGLKALWGTQAQKPVFQPARSRRVAEHRHSCLCAKRAFLPRFFSAVGCRRFLVWCPEIRSYLALCDVLRSTNTELPPALRRRCRSLRRVVRPFVMEQKLDEIHRLRRRPRREAAPGPRKTPCAPSMPYGQKRDRAARRGQHIPIHVPACA